MNAALVESFQSSPRYTQFQDPAPMPDESAITVLAAGLHPIVKALAKGSHYGSTGQLPFVPGLDGVGRLDDGRRVFFGASRSPFGSMAERTIAKPPFLIPLPDALPDTAAAALGNPAMSSWAALSRRAEFTPGESVLMLGATGVAGQLAVQIARRRGAKRVIACGRNPQALEKTRSLGADATISLELPHDELVAALRREIDAGIDIVLDYLWGAPAKHFSQRLRRRAASASKPGASVISRLATAPARRSVSKPGHCAAPASRSWAVASAASLCLTWPHPSPTSSPKPPASRSRLTSGPSRCARSNLSGTNPTGRAASFSFPSGSESGLQEY